MRNIEQVSVRLAVLFGGAVLTIFGAYIFFEKSLLPILVGVTEERSGLTLRDVEPFSFWTFVMLFVAISLGILSLGLW